MYSNIAIIIGVLLLLGSLFILRRTFRLIRERSVAVWWAILGLFIAGFAVGYSLYIASALIHWAPIPEEQLIAQILLWGAVFVLVCAQLLSSTAREFLRLSGEQVQQRKALEELAAALEERASARTKDLEAANASLHLRGTELAAANHQLSAVIAQRQALEEQRFQARLERSQRLESLGVLAGGVAHDFNNLLVGILAGASWLKEQKLGEEALPAITAIETSARHGADLAGQLLDYTGRSGGHRQAIDLNDLVSEMRDLLQVSKVRSAELVSEFGQGLPTVIADSSQLRQIVMNLIVNASDALDGEPGTVTLRTRLEDCAAELLDSTWDETPPPPGRYICLEVEDTGLGMDPKTKAQMFDPFFTTKNTGRGLGLAATLGIVKSHGGTIQVRTAPGEGTCVRVFLPTSEESVRTEEKPVSGASARLAVDGDLILVVDDEAVIRTLVRAILSASGYRVETASDGAEGLAKLAEIGEQLSLVILDLSMPVMNGEEVLTEIRKSWPTLPVLVSSGYNDSLASGRLAKDTRLGFLPKPFDVDQLTQAVEDTRRKRIPSESTSRSQA